MITSFMQLSGLLIIRIIYAKNPKKIDEISPFIKMLLSMGFMFWIICLLCSLMDTDWITRIVEWTWFPAIVIIWSIKARMEPAECVSSDKMCDDTSDLVESKTESNIILDNADDENQPLDEKELDITDTQKTLYCRKCGNSIPEDSVFCPHCGVEVKK